VPRRPHGLLDQPVGIFVLDKTLGGGIETEGPSQTDGHLGQVDESAGAVAVFLVQGEFLSRFSGLAKIGYLKLGVGKRGDLLLKIGYIRSKASIELSSRTLDERRQDVLVLSVKNDFAAIGIFQPYPAPTPAGVGVLLRTVGLDLVGACFIFVQR